MTNEYQLSNGPLSSLNFGTRLQSARKALHFNTKDVAARLRLNENIIHMMEREEFPNNIPTTFARGYLRSYARLLQIPEDEIKQALDSMNPPPPEEPVGEVLKQIQKQPLTSGDYFMQASTYVIALTLLGLVGAWWYSHNTGKETTIVAETQIIPLTTNQPSDTQKPSTPVEANKAAPLALASNQPATTQAAAPAAAPSTTSATTPNSAPSAPTPPATTQTQMTANPAAASPSSNESTTTQAKPKHQPAPTAMADDDDDDDYTDNDDND